MIDQPQNIMIVAGEQSGDILGSELIAAMRLNYPSAHFYGIGGDRMISKGFDSWYPIDRLSVMGFVEPLKRLPELLRMLFSLKKALKSDSRPDIFIGIDSPEFNIWLELTAKKNDVYSVHYVSPSVWAWRQGRIKRIKKAVDLMLTLLPFEAEFYRKHNVDVGFVGHPLADTLPMQPNREEARSQLSLQFDTKVCALMPGSRQSEVRFLLPIMIDAALELRKRFQNMEFLIPAANDERYAEIQSFLKDYQLDGGYIRIIRGQSHAVMTAANCVVMASGTTALEAMLLKRPMVICYKCPNLTWQIMSRIVKTKWVGLPNLLANAEVAPEFLQDNATPENLIAAVENIFSETYFQESTGDESENTSKTLKLFHKLHHDLRQNASHTAAQMIAERWNKRNT